MLDTTKHRCGIYLRISDDKEGFELGFARQQEDCLFLSESLRCVVYRIYKDEREMDLIRDLNERGTIVGPASFFALWHRMT